MTISAIPEKDDELPVLTDAIGERAAAPSKPSPVELARLESRICAASLNLAEDLVREACADIEDTIVKRVVSRLRSELPAHVNEVLQKYFDERD